MHLLLPVFFVSLLFGQLTAIPLSRSVFVYLHDIVLVVMLGVYLVKKPALLVLHHGRVANGMLIFILVCLGSLLANSYRYAPIEVLVSSLYLVRWALYAGLYFLVVDTRGYTQKWLWGLYGFGCGLALIGIIQYVLYPDLRNLFYLGWDPHYYRLFSTLFDPNFTGLLLSLTVILGIHLFTRRHSFLMSVSQCVVLAGVLLTFSRSSYIVLFVGIMVWIIGAKKWKLFVPVVLFSFVILYIPRQPLEGWNLFRSVSTMARVNNIKQSFTAFLRSPIIGYGFNAIKFLHLVPIDAQTNVISRSGAGIDNSFLFLLTTTGIVGTIAYVWLLYVMAKPVFGLVKQEKMKSYAMIYLISLGMILVHSMFTNSLFYPWVMIWVWILTAFIPISGTSRGGRSSSDFRLGRKRRQKGYLPRHPADSRTGT